MAILYRKTPIGTILPGEEGLSFEVAVLATIQDYITRNTHSTPSKSEKHYREGEPVNDSFIIEDGEFAVRVELGSRAI